MPQKNTGNTVVLLQLCQDSRDNQMIVFNQYRSVDTFLHRSHGYTRSHYKEGSLIISNSKKPKKYYALIRVNGRAMKQKEIKYTIEAFYKHTLTDSRLRIAETSDFKPIAHRTRTKQQKLEREMIRNQVRRILHKLDLKYTTLVRSR